MIHFELGLGLEIDEHKRGLVVTTDRVVIVFVVHKHNFERTQFFQIEAWNAKWKAVGKREAAAKRSVAAACSQEAIAAAEAELAAVQREMDGLAKVDFTWNQDHSNCREIICIVRQCEATQTTEGGAMEVSDAMEGGDVEEDVEGGEGEQGG